MLTQLAIHLPGGVEAPLKEVSVERNTIFETETLTLRITSKDFTGKSVAVHEVVLFGTPAEIEKIVHGFSCLPTGGGKEGADGG